MSTTAFKWKKLFLFSLGLALGTSFCMKWMESDFWQGNEKFTITGLEWFYSKEKVTAILSSLDLCVKTVLRYHLIFDFAFMTGVYPGIAAICMLAAEKVKPAFGKILFALAALQLLAWLGDIGENYYLLRWIKNPQIGDEWNWYHLLVAVKWLIALAGVFIGVIALLAGRRKRI